MHVLFVYWYTGGEPEHHCKLKPGENMNDTIPLVFPLVQKGTKRWRYAQCERYANDSLVSNLTIPCPDGWHYDTREFKATIVTEV